MSVTDFVKAPTFTVVVPCYNDGCFLERSVGSIERQDYADWEIVIVDDGSDDDSPAICQGLRERLGHRLRYHRQTNAGVSAARNAGIDCSNGSFLVFLDADDELLRTALSQYHAAFQTQTDAVWLIGGNQWERDGKVRVRHPKLPESRHGRFSEFLNKQLHIGNISNMCFSRHVFDGIRFPENLAFGEDLALFAVLFSQVDPMMVEGITALAHRREDSLRTRFSMVDTMKSQIQEVIFKHPLLDPSFQKYSRIYESRHCRSVMRQAYKEQRYGDAVEWYSRMVKASPSRAMSPKWFARYLIARRRQHSQKKRPLAVHRRLAHRLGYDLEKHNKQLLLQSHLRQLLPVLGIDLVIDVGANVGQYGLLLRNEVGYQGQIHSFEPLPSAFRALEAAARDDDGWFVHHVALSDTDGQMLINESRKTEFSSFHAANAFGKTKYAKGIAVADQISVNVQRLDGLLPELVPDFSQRNVLLKMDTQGHDKWVFAGAGVFADGFRGLQSELSVYGIYKDVPDYVEMLTEYRSHGYELSGVYTVNRNRATGHIIELDCVFASKRPIESTSGVKPLNQTTARLHRGV